MLTEVHIIGKKFVHLFTVDGVIVEQEVTEKDYVTPSIMDKGIYVGSACRPLLDTKTGDLGLGQYYKDGDVIAFLDDERHHQKETLTEIDQKKAEIDTMKALSVELQTEISL